MLLLVGEGAASPPDVPELTQRRIAVRRVTGAGSSGGDLIDANGEVAKRYGSTGIAI